MTDEENDKPSPTEFLADVAVRLIADDLRSGEEWRPAYTLGFVLDSSLEALEDMDVSESVKEWVEQLVLDIATTLTYAHLHPVLTEDDIESAAQQFRDMMERGEELRNNKTETPEED